MFLRIFIQKLFSTQFFCASLTWKNIFVIFLQLNNLCIIRIIALYETRRHPLFWTPSKFNQKRKMKSIQNSFILFIKANKIGM